MRLTDRLFELLGDIFIYWGGLSVTYQRQGGSRRGARVARSILSSHCAAIERLEVRNLLAAEIDILGNGQSIQDNDTSPCICDHTDFGLVDVNGGTVTRTFTIKNLGTTQLALTGDPLVVVTGFQSSEFSVTAQPSDNRLTPGQSVTFQIRFDPNSTGLRQTNVRIDNSDSNEGDYVFRLQGTGSVPLPGPPGTPNLSGSHDTGVSNTDNITSRTSGLTFTWPAGTNATSYEYEWDDSTPDISTGGTVIDVDAPAGNGSHEFWVRSVNSAGKSTPVKLDVYIDRDGPSVSGPDLNSANDSGFLNNDNTTRDQTVNLNWASSGLIDHYEYGWNLSNLTPTNNTSVALSPPSSNGSFNFYVKAVGTSGLTDTESLQITFDNTAPTSPEPTAPVGEITTQTPDIRWPYNSATDWKFRVDLEENDGTNWVKAPGFSSPLTAVRTDGLRVSQQLSFGKPYRVRIATYDIAGNVGNFGPWHTFNVAEPDIVISGNGNVIVDGDNSPSVSDFTAFGSVEVGDSSDSRTFVIGNTGPIDLQLTGSPDRVDITGPNRDDFVVVQPNGSTISQDGIRTFGIAFAPTGTGLRNATVSIASNDPDDENPYTFAIQGTGVVSPAFDSGPWVTSQTPTGSNAESVRFVQLVFSEPLREETFSNDYVSVTLNGTRVDAMATLVATRNSNIHRIAFPESLTIPGEYVVSVTTSVTDRAGNPLNQYQDEEANGEERDRYVGTFVIVNPSPYVIGMTPNSNSIVTESIDHIDLTFSEPVQVSTLVPNVYITRDGESIGISGDTPEHLSGNTYRFHFAPQAPGRFTVIVSVGVKDLLDQPMDQNYEASFSTEYADEPLPIRIAFAPDAERNWKEYGPNVTPDLRGKTNEQTRANDWAEDYIQEHGSFSPLEEGDVDEMSNLFEAFHSSGLGDYTLSHEYRFGLGIADVILTGTVIQGSDLEYLDANVARTFLGRSTALAPYQDSTYQTLQGEQVLTLTHQSRSKISQIAYDSSSFQDFLENALKPRLDSAVKSISSGVPLAQFRSSMLTEFDTKGGSISTAFDDAIYGAWFNEGQSVSWDAYGTHPPVLKRIFGGTQGYEIDMKVLSIDAGNGSYSAELVVRIMDTFGMDWEDAESFRANLADILEAEGNLRRQWDIQHLSSGGTPFIHQVEIPVFLLDQPIVSTISTSGNSVVDVGPGSPSSSTLLLPDTSAERLLSVEGLTANADFRILDTAGEVVVERDSRSAFADEFNFQNSVWVAPYGLAYLVETAGGAQQLSITESVLDKTHKLDTSAYMLGDVRVNVVLVEISDDATSTWTTSDIEGIKTSVVDGGVFWEQAREAFSGRPDLHFDYAFDFADSPLQVGSDLVEGGSNEFYGFVDALRKAAGFVVADDDSLPDRLRDINLYNYQQRIASAADFSTTLFFVKNEFSDAPSAWAQLGGPWAVFTGSTATTPEIIAHELGNVFHALDEYPGGDPYTATSGYIAAQNLNATEGNPDLSNQVPSIMLDPFAAFADRHVSASVAAMVGWQDQDGDDIPDVIDVPHTFIGGGGYLADTNTYRFIGYSTVNSVPNENPNPMSNDAFTIGVIDQVEYRIDGGSWTVVATPNSKVAEIDFSISGFTAGEHLVDVRTSDSVGILSNTVSQLVEVESAPLLPGIHGFKFDDDNANGVWDATESTLAGAEVYLDLNGDASHDGNEPVAVTDGNGLYRFQGLSTGSYVVREVVPSGATATYPVTSPIRLSDNEASSENNIRVDGGDVLWTDGDNLLLFRGGIVTQLYQGPISGPPAMHDGQVVWRVGTDLQFYDGETTRAISQPGVSLESPDIKDGRIVAMGYTGGRYQVFYYDGTSLAQITANSLDDVNPRFDGNSIVWQRDLANRQVIRYELTTGSETRIDNGNFSFTAPVISDGLAVWTGSDGNALQVFSNDGTTTQQMSNNPSGARDPATSGGRVVWKEFGSGMEQLMLFDGSTTSPITPLDSRPRSDVAIDGGRVAWREYDGSDFEVFVYEGTSTTNVTNNAVADLFPVLGGNQLVMLAEDGTTTNDQEITLYHFDAAHFVDYVEGQIVQNINFGDVGPDIIPTMVVDRQFFYNNSFFDNNEPAANANDDAAIATDKTALLPAGVATFANYTSYTKGINGLMFDIHGLADPDNVSAANFEFKAGNTDDPTNWPAAPAPLSVTVREDVASPGVDRVTIIWADGVIQKQWLEVTIKNDAEIGLSSPDVSYFGNAVGESGNSATNTFVDGSDFAGARDNPHNFLNRAPIDDAFDYNRDSFVDGSDLAIARDNNTNFLTALKLLNLAGGAQASNATQSDETEFDKMSQLASTESALIGAGFCTLSPILETISPASSINVLALPTRFARFAIPALSESPSVTTIGPRQMDATQHVGLRTSFPTFDVIAPPNSINVLALPTRFGAVGELNFSGSPSVTTVGPKQVTAPQQRDSSVSWASPGLQAAAVDAVFAEKSSQNVHQPLLRTRNLAVGRAELPIELNDDLLDDLTSGI